MPAVDTTAAARELKDWGNRMADDLALHRAALVTLVSACIDLDSGKRMADAVNTACEVLGVNERYEWTAEGLRQVITEAWLRQKEDRLDAEEHR